MPEDNDGEDKTIQKRKKHMIFTPMTPESSFQYADLNIKHESSETTIAMVKRAIRMGYDSIAINQDIGDISEYATEADMLWTPKGAQMETEEPPKKKKKKQEVAQDGLAGALKKKLLPIPFFVSLDELDTEELRKQGKVFRQFSRLTFTANEQIVLNKTFTHPTVIKYDLIAVRPGDPSVLDTLSRKTELFDIITIDRLESEKAKWLGQSKVLDRMRGDGIFYEISYAECLLTASRRQALFNGRVLLRSLKSKSIIISSGAETMLDLRAPVDVMNMMTLWGVQNNEARKFVSGNPKNLLLQSECRGTVNGDVHSMKLTESNSLVEEISEESVNDEAGETRAPPIKVKMNSLQYDALLKATKEANEAVKRIKEKQQNQQPNNSAT